MKVVQRHIKTFYIGISYLIRRRTNFEIDHVTRDLKRPLM